MDDHKLPVRLCRHECGRWKRGNGREYVKCGALFGIKYRTLEDIKVENSHAWISIIRYWYTAQQRGGQNIMSEHVTEYIFYEPLYSD
jgi:hypothetical protein